MSRKMRAAIWYGPGEFRLESVDIPTINPHEVLIKVEACYFGATHVRAILKGHPEMKPPLIIGRMLSGEIAQLGSEVTGLKEGMRVTVNPELPCGKCFYCLRNNYAQCLNLYSLPSGGLADYIVVPKELIGGIYEIPEGVSFEEGAYTETLACTLQGMECANVAPGDTVVILGSGGVGLTFLQLARMSGAIKIIISDIYDEALSSAKRLGAERVVNVKNEDLSAIVKEETGGFGADVVIEAVGSSQTYKSAFELVRKGGTVLAFGGCPKGSEFLIDPNVVHYGEIKFIGTYHYHPGMFKRALDLIASKSINLDSIITHRLPLDRVVEEGVEIYQKPECKTLVIKPNM